MKNHFLRLAAVMFLSVGFCAFAGELTYVPIPAAQSDASSGISPENQYTTALDAGSAANRVINGVTLNASPGEGQTIMANNAAITALSGSLMITGGQADNILADGTLREVLSDVIYNNGAGDNSQQEIVLDPQSLIAGTTYDLRVYVANAGGGQDRQVNLSFVGDGQAAVETGFFNEDDARTSPAGFQDPNQVYVINYRFTWDGQSTPGVTVSQKSGQAPFVLYALTNHPVGQAQAAAPAPPLPAAPAAADPGVTTGLVTAESDQIGVTSDTFYSDERLNRNGRWIEIKKYGRCWQPTGCPDGWRPYLRGRFGHCGDCGWTWISDASEEEWGWAVYHYGRWARVPGIGCGWAWIPGTVWSGAWVSWRQGTTPDCTCVGWAPLPPEAICRVNVGISRWVDRECDIGPDYWTFVHVRDFGSSSYSECGRCILDRRRYVNIVEHTTNITNISYTNVNINVNVNVNVNVTNINVYNGGPDFQHINQQIQQQGGTGVEQIHINHVSEADLKGGKGSHLEGNTLALLSPKITADKNPKFVPKIAEKVSDKKIDHGWNEIKDKKVKNDLKTKIAEQSKGLTPETTKATLPADVAEKIKNTKQAGASPSPSPGVTVTASPGAKGFAIPALTATVSPGAKGTASPALTATVFPGVKGTATPALAATASPGATGTASPGKSPDAKMTPLAGQSPTVSPAGASPSPTATVSPGLSPVAKFTPVPGQSPTVFPPGVSPSPKAGQSPTLSLAGTATPIATVSPDVTKKQDPFGILKKGSPTPATTASPAAAGSPDPTGFPKGTATPGAPSGLKFPGKSALTPTPSPVGKATATPAQSPVSTFGKPAQITSPTPSSKFPETFGKPALTTTPSPTVAGKATATPGQSPSSPFGKPTQFTTPTSSPSPGGKAPTGKFPEALGKPTPLATATPIAAGQATATPAQSPVSPFGKPTQLTTPAPSPTAVGKTPFGKFPETGKTSQFATPAPSPTMGKVREAFQKPQQLATATPDQTPKQLPKTSGFATATPAPTQDSGKRSVPTFQTPIPTQTAAPMQTPKIGIMKTPFPTATPRPAVTPNTAADAAAKANAAAAAAKASADAAAKAQQQQLNQQKLQQQQFEKQKQLQDASAAAKSQQDQLNQQKLQQQQLQQQKQMQDAAAAKSAAAAKANADAAAKANAAAAAKAQQQQQLQQQMQQQKQLQQQQLQQKQSQDAAAAAAKAQQQQQLLQQQKQQQLQQQQQLLQQQKQQQLQQQQLQQRQQLRGPKPTPTPTPTPIG